jgi:hypothetical protein
MHELSNRHARKTAANAPATGTYIAFLSIAADILQPTASVVPLLIKSMTCAALCSPKNP